MPDLSQGADHHTWMHADQAAAAVRFDHLRIEQLRPRYPPWLGRWAVGPLARQHHPLSKMREQRQAISFKAVSEKQRDTVGRQHLHDLMDQLLGHCQGTLANIESQQ